MISPLAAALWTGSCESVSTSASDPSVKTNKSQQVDGRKSVLKVLNQIPYSWGSVACHKIYKKGKNSFFFLLVSDSNFL